MTRSVTRYMMARLSAILLTLLLFVPMELRGQVGAADVLGTVTDTTGAVVTGAKVTVKNQGTAAQRTAISSDKGEYSFIALANGTYTLTVEMTGFKTYVHTGLPLSTGDRARYDATLTTGAVTETVQVTASAAAMQTASSEVTSTVEEKAVSDLPLNGRSLESAIQVQPGLTSSTNGGSSDDRRPSFSITAASGGTNNQMVDGFDNNERNLGLDGIRPSVDSVQEIKVDTSSFSAEYGRASGAVVNIITKGGTNTYHGSAYEFIRNDYLDTHAWGTTDKPKLRQNYYGGSIGGPVRIPWLYNGKDKTFFFVDWEQFRRIKGITANAISGPTKYELDTLKSTGNLDISDLAGSLPIYWEPNTSIPCDAPGAGCNKSGNGTAVYLDEFDPQGNSQWVLEAKNIDPIMKNYFLLFPDPNLPDCISTTAFGCDTGNYLRTPPETMVTTNLDIRIDQRFGANNQFFGRFEYDPTTTLEPEPYPQITSGPFAGIYPGGSGSAFAGPALSNTYGLQLDFVHIFNQNLMLDLKAAYTRMNLQSQPFNYQTGAATQVGWDASLDTSDVLPGIGGPWASWTALMGSSNAEPIVDVNNVFQYAGSLSYHHGSHDIKFGAGLIRRQINAWSNTIAGGLFFEAGRDNIGAPGFTGPLPYADDRLNFLNGSPAMELRQDNLYKSGFRVWEPSVYLLDNWRVNSKLNLNLGIRYDIYTPFQEAHGHYANFLPSCLNASATSVLTTGLTCFINGDQNPTIGVKPDYLDIQPRIGFAYSLGSKTVVRGAFGTTYFTPDQGQVAIGTASPESVMQNYNPQSSFNFQGILPFMGCSKTTAAGGTIGCISNGPAQPTIMTDLDINSFPSNPGISSVSAKDTNFKNGYAYMTNLAVQRQIGASTVTVAYVGSFGRHMLQLSNLDLPSETGTQSNPTPYKYGYTTGGGPDTVLHGQLPFLNTIAYMTNGQYSNYNGMELIYNRRFANGLNFNTNYNWGHALNNACGAGSACTFISTEPANFEYGGLTAQRVAGSLGYEIPLGKNFHGIAGGIVKGWKVNAIGYWQTGGALTVTMGSRLGISGVGNARPNVVAPTKLSHPTLSEWFNTAAFALPDYGVYGTERVNQVRAPNSRNVDLSVNKRFPIYESLKLEFRAECFNLGNFANYGNPGVNMAASNFGKISSVSNESRQFQFALKLLF